MLPNIRRLDNWLPRCYLQAKSMFIGAVRYNISIVFHTPVLLVLSDCHHLQSHMCWQTLNSRKQRTQLIFKIGLYLCLTLHLSNLILVFDFTGVVESSVCWLRTEQSSGYCLQSRYLQSTIVLIILLIVSMKPMFDSINSFEQELTAKQTWYLLL